ncbi:hypothetical protein OKW21_003071 [Catalinimonas alkaloidigena]|uniref:hypothetical protein n=1 Tax=Catalinimonas alkaloidigena TaxID=1075417 RepID=UPI002405074F|nr:hypothetical protein [Catalinimonas alkaloidigena]MDF9797808.1 hypothetical protein [Catalinimonas alkaloidigena]
MDPFFEFACGLNISQTVTSYKGMGGDGQASFWEALLNVGDGQKKIRAKAYTESGSNLGIGIGAFIKNWMVVKLVYNLSLEIRFVRKEDIMIGSYINYITTKADSHIFSLSTGISLQ